MSVHVIWHMYWPSRINMCMHWCIRMFIFLARIQRWVACCHCLHIYICGYICVYMYTPSVAYVYEISLLSFPSRCLYVWHGSFIYVTWRIHMCHRRHSNVCYICDIAHSCVWYGSFTCVAWSIHMCAMTHVYVWHDSSIRLIWLIHMCAITDTYVWQNSFICVTWLIHMCAIAHLYVWQDIFICVTWRIHTCDTTESYVWHDSFIYLTWRIHVCDIAHSHAWYASLSYLSHAHSHVGHESFGCVMCDTKHFLVCLQC